MIVPIEHGLDERVASLEAELAVVRADLVRVQQQIDLGHDVIGRRIGTIGLPRLLKT